MSEFYPTYDPKRHEVRGYIADLKKQRSDRARKLLEFRAKITKDTIKTFGIAKLNEWARLHVGRKALERTDNASLRALAMSHWRYAEEPIGYNGNEYYTACGMDDYIGEKKEYSRSIALEIWRTIGRFD